MGVSGWSDLATHTPYDYLQEPFEARPPDAMQKDYPRLYTGDSGPTPRALDAASSPSGAFFYFLQPQLWENVAAETNDYFDASIDERVEGQHAKQLKRALKHPELKFKSRDAIARTPIDCTFYRSKQRETCASLEHKGGRRHTAWVLRAVYDPRSIHAYLKKLHFSSNEDPRAAKDRAWKLRPVQDRFAAGYTLPAIMAFDECNLPSRSTFNRMRVYIKNKPHKWGTTLFMFFEVYCGKKERAGQAISTDYKSDPAAVVRNLQQVFGPTAVMRQFPRLSDRLILECDNGDPEILIGGGEADGATSVERKLDVSGE
ncbi:hypothetical protein PHMEG_00013551 [Phytophthora megakarya]|uniref:PiggyBac transposable element-derived protein domain-containing protein n=1 Tax=Phytophthora megakarya TaxID=4795 RepID=A0A225W7N6_9STRA|nr:hypothetical protein PHMEG_00013551 [Phytophthora megakarya]